MWFSVTLGCEEPSRLWVFVLVFFFNIRSHVQSPRCQLLQSLGFTVKLVTV